MSYVYEFIANAREAGNVTCAFCGIHIVIPFFPRAAACRWVAESGKLMYLSTESFRVLNYRTTRIKIIYIYIYIYMKALMNLIELRKSGEFL
jgi:hypothetical protein